MEEESQKLVLEVFYDVEKDIHCWKFHHKLNSFLMIGILELVIDDLIQGINEATDEKFGGK